MAKNGQLIRYFLVVLQGLGSDYLILKTLIVFFAMHPTVVKLISTVMVFTLNAYCRSTSPLK